MEKDYTLRGARGPYGKRNARGVEASSFWKRGGETPLLTCVTHWREEEGGGNFGREH